MFKVRHSRSATFSFSDIQAKNSEGQEGSVTREPEATELN